MKKYKFYKILGLIAVLTLVALIIVANTLKKNESTSWIQTQEAKAQSAITYDKVKDGENAVTYNDGSDTINNFTLDAYFINENGDHVRGVCSNLNELPVLNIEINASQFVDATIKDLTITFKSNNINTKVQTGAGGLIESVNDKEIKLYELTGGYAATINVNLEQTATGINYTYYPNKLSAINGVHFSGKYVKDGQEYKFEKDVNYTVDWTGSFELNEVKISNSMGNNKVIVNDDDIIVLLEVYSSTLKDDDMLINDYAEYTLEGLAVNGVEPTVSISARSSKTSIGNIKYENDILTYTSYATSKDGKTDDRDAAYYRPYEVGENKSVITLTYSGLKGKITDEYKDKTYSVKCKHVGFGNPNIQYENSTSKGVCETETKEANVQIVFEDFTGEIISYESHIKDLNKINTRLIYSNDVNVENANYVEYWSLQINLANFYQKLKIQRGLKKSEGTEYYNNETGSVCFFNSEDSKEYSMDECKSYQGITIDQTLIDMLGGEDKAKIDIYSDDSGNEVQIIDTITKAGTYYYVDENNQNTSYKNIIVYINSPVENTGTTILWHYVNIDNEAVKNKYSDINLFDKFTQVHSTTEIYGITENEYEYIKDGYASADYNDGYLIYSVPDNLRMNIFEKTQTSYRVNFGVGQSITTSSYQLGYWLNPKIILELPKEYTEVDNIEEVTLNILAPDVEQKTLEIKKDESTGRVIIVAELEGEIKYKAGYTSNYVTFEITSTPDKDAFTSTVAEGEIRAFVYTSVADGTNLMARENHNAEDIYDIDVDGDKTELTSVETTKVEFFTPAGIYTDMEISADVDGKTLSATPPDVLEISPNKTNNAKVELNLYNGYAETTIHNLKIIGKIPYTGNTFVLEDDKSLESTFNTTMTSDGIIASDNFDGKIYYSEQEKIVKSGEKTEVDTSIWKTKDQVTDWSKIKSYLIVFNEATTSTNTYFHTSFSYNINLPEQAFGIQSFATHAVEYEDQTLMQTEANKTGISFVSGESINLEISKAEDKDGKNKIKGATYELSNYNEGQPIDVTRDGLVYTVERTSNPNMLFAVYTGIKYKLTETSAPEGYEKHDPIIFEIIKTDDSYTIKIDDASPSNTMFADNLVVIKDTSDYITNVIIVDNKTITDSDYSMDIIKQKTNGDTLSGSKFSVYLDNATTPILDNTEITSKTEITGTLEKGKHTFWITENQTSGDPYVNILDGKYIKVNVNVNEDTSIDIVDDNGTVNNDYFEVYESDKKTKVTDDNIIKNISVSIKDKKIDVTVKNPIQYNVDIETVDTLDSFIKSLSYSIYRNDTLVTTKNVVTTIEQTESPMSAGRYEYYFTQTNELDRYVNILSGRFVKITVDVDGDGNLTLVSTQLYNGEVGSASAKEETSEDLLKCIKATIDNTSAIETIKLKVIYPTTFTVEVDKIATDNEPIEDTKIEISSEIIDSQDAKYSNEKISGIDSISADGTVSGTTEAVIDDGTQARISYNETYVYANKENGYYTYEIKEISPAGGQYVNMLEGYKVVVRVKVYGNGALDLVDENGNVYDANAEHKYTIEATNGKTVTEDLYDYVYVDINNNNVRAILNAQVMNPIKYKIAVNQSVYGTDGRVSVSNMPVLVDGEDLRAGKELSPVFATDKLTYKIRQTSDGDSELINILDGYYLGVDLYIPGDGDLKTIAQNGDKTTNSYRIYKNDGTEVNFEDTNIDDFVKIQITKDANNVCTLNINIEVPQSFNLKLLKKDADTNETLNNVEFSIVSKLDGNEIDLKDVKNNLKTILTNSLKTGSVDGENGVIKLDNILIEKAGTYTFEVKETTPITDENYKYKDKKEDIVLTMVITEGESGYVVKEVKTNNEQYAESSKSSDNDVVLNVKNERITGTYKLELNKISQLLGQPIDGSKFSIRAYKMNDDGEQEDITLYNSVVKNSETQVVPNTFDINTNNGIFEYSIMIENTDKHFIELTEVQAPDTYTKLRDPIVLKVTPKLVGEYDDAKYVIDSIELVKGDNDGLVKLTSFEDEKINLEITNNQFDLALRQYVTSINGEDISRWNTTEINTDKLVTGEDTTAEYYNNKESLRIYAGQEVIYTFRVYNEGQIDGYADEITAYLPKQLEFLKDDEFNKDWVIEKVDDSITVIKNSSLSKENGVKISTNSDEENPNLIKAFDNVNNVIDYVEVQVKCKIKDDEEPRQSVVTVAEVTKFEGENRPEVVDRDSNYLLELTSSEKLADYAINEANENGYVPGYEDDDDFELLNIERFDLGLLKYTSNINETNIESSDITYEVDKDGNGKFNKDAIEINIADGNKVEYTLRAYNKGTVDGYASIIKDEIPQELLFDKDSEINKQYKWKLFDADGNETDDVTKAKYVTTDYLSIESGKERMTDSDEENPNLIKAFDEETMKMPDYKEIKIAFIANLPDQKDGEIVNIAEITDVTDETGKTVKDEDLTNNKSNSVDKLKVVYFDLSLDKWVSKTIVSEKGKENITETGITGKQESIIKIDLKKSNINDVVIKVEYTIKVKNEGTVSGYAKEITDYIPEGFKFVPEDNPAWTKDGDNAVTTEFEDKLLQPGETATTTITLTWINSESNVGLKSNIAEITKDYNNQGDTKDIDSTPGNKDMSEDDISDSAQTLLTIKTGSDIIVYAVLTLGLITIIAIGAYFIKRKVK